MELSRGIGVRSVKIGVFLFAQGLKHLHLNRNRFVERVVHYDSTQDEHAAREEEDSVRYEDESKHGCFLSVVAVSSK